MKGKVRTRMRQDQSASITQLSTFPLDSRPLFDSFARGSLQNYLTPYSRGDWSFFLVTTPIQDSALTQAMSTNKPDIHRLAREGTFYPTRGLELDQLDGDASSPAWLIPLHLP